MKLAFCLFHYFPFGGLQRDFLRIAKTLKKRGHEIHVYTMNWDGEKEEGFHLHFIKAKGLQNHTRCASFVQKTKKNLDHEAYDLVIGFNKMPYLDVYYAADVCYQARVKEQRSFFYPLLPRFRQWASFEKSVFALKQKTEILLISAQEQQKFIDYYQTESERFHLLPPGINKDRIAPNNAKEIRHLLRQTHHIKNHELIILMVGSGFKTKGLDRSIKALAALPPELKKRCTLWVIGDDDESAFLKLAKKLHIAKQITFFGGRNDVGDFLLSADLLIHPAYHENTGTVLLEAVVSGLPVLTVEHCGYAHYIKEAEAGIVLSSPFQQDECDQALANMLLSVKREPWQQNALRFAKEADIYSLPEKAADLIEQIGQKK